MAYIATVNLKGTTFEPGDIVPAEDWRTRAGLINRGFLLDVAEGDIKAVQAAIAGEAVKLSCKRAGVIFVKQAVEQYKPVSTPVVKLADEEQIKAVSDDSNEADDDSVLGEKPKKKKSKSSKKDS